MTDILSLLVKHHRNGDEFARLMQETADKRFDDGFWSLWEQWIEPVLKEHPKIADLGCGPGVLLKKLRARYPTAMLTGVEYAPYMLKALDNSENKVVIHDLHQTDLSIPDNSQDVMTFIHSLHELIYPTRALQSAHRCLKKGGRCLIIDWVRMPLKDYLAGSAHMYTEEDIFSDKITHTELHDVFHHFTEHNRYSVEDIDWLLEKVGFTTLEKTEYHSKQFALWVVEK